MIKIYFKQFMSLTLFGLLISCSNGGSTAPGSGNLPTTTATKNVLASVQSDGTTPIVGATVYLCAGASLSKDLVCQTVIGSGVTDSQGFASIDYTLTNSSGTDNLYLYSTGGEINGVQNQYVNYVASIGLASNPLTSVSVNPGSSIAMVSSYGQLIGKQVVSSAQLVNATNSLSHLINLSTGAPLLASVSTIGLGTTESFDYLGNILAYCANSTAPSSSCGAEFSAIQSTLGLAYPPGNTLVALIDMLLNPAAAYNLTQGQSGPYGSVQTPHSFIQGVTYNNTAYWDSNVHPLFTSIDSNGNVWLASCAGATDSAITELVANNQYTPVTVLSASTSTKIAGPIDLAVDSGGNIWVANNYSPYMTTEIVPNPNNPSAPLSVTNISEGPGTGATGPVAMTVDNSGNVWVANYNGTNSSTPLASEYPAASPTVPLSYAEGPSNSGPDAITSDANGNIWLADCLTNTITELKKSGTSYTSLQFSITGVYNPAALAVDPSGNLWIANSDCGGSSANIMELPGENTSSPTIVLSSGQTVPLAFPIGMAADSGGNIWVTDFVNNDLVEIQNKSGTFTPVLAGVIPSSNNSPHGLSIDSGGNIWVADTGNTSNGSGSGVTEFVGLAAPIKTPTLGPPVAP